MIISYCSWSAVPILKDKLYFTPNSHSLTGKDSARLNQMNLLTNMTAAEYGKLTGKKLNLLQRIAWNTARHQMKSKLKPFTEPDGPGILSKLSWLFRGILLGPVALLIGYLFLKDEEKQLIKWIWFGCIGFAILAVIVLLA